MNADTQRERARSFRDRHTESDILVLPNTWDAASAIIYEMTGLDAAGTSSAGIAASLGYPDGEHLSREQMLAVVDRIAHSVSIPVSADIEAGYGDTPDEVAETVSKTIDAGAVGVNLEDGTGDPDNPLVDIETHVARIEAARDAADAADLPLAINGRTDIYWLDIGEDSEQLEMAVERANAYYEAGSDCLFIPGITDADTIEALVEGIDGPLNILGGPGAPAIPDLESLGVARVSVGSGPMRATLGYLQQISEALQESGTYTSMEDAIPYGDLNDALVTAVNRRSA